MKLDKKTIRIIDIALIVVTLAAIVIIALLVGFRTPYVIFPQDNLTTNEDTILFSFGNAEEILIDDNQNFTSPKILKVKDDLLISLEPGVYYWKVRGILDSDVRKLTIQSVIDLKMSKTDEGYVLKNAGNKNLNIEVYNGSNLEENFSLLKSDEKDVSGSKFIGSQDE